MNATGNTTTVIKGDLDSTIHQGGFGSFTDAGGSFGIIFVLVLAKILFVLSLVGMFYLFTFSPALGLLALCILVGIFVYWLTHPKPGTEVN